MVPRWRAASATIATGELAPISLGRPPIAPSEFEAELHTAADAFRVNRTVGHATDLLSAAVVLNNESAGLDAARYLLSRPGHAGRAATFLAQRLQDEAQFGVSPDLGRPRARRSLSARSDASDGRYGELATPEATIGAIRRALRRDANNPIAWLNLSRTFAVIGQHGKAVRAMRVALAQAPDHRFALRSAARLFLHVGREDEAHAILRRSPATRVDPWLMAAEVAVATIAGRPPRSIKLARAALAAGQFDPFHLGEVATALGTVEAEAGKTKVARKLFQQALIDPSDNVVAQAEWASRFLGLFEFDERFLTRPLTYEANAWAAYVGGRWETALEHARRWLSDEPFSGRAAAMGSAVAAVGLVNFDEAIAFAMQGVLSNPDDAALNNNLVFVLAEGGRLAEARHEHDRTAKLTGDSDQFVVRLANSALLAYRENRPADGAERYRDAIAAASQAKNRSLARMAAAYWAGEILRALEPDAPEDSSIGELVAMMAADPSPDIQLALARLQRVRKQRLAPMRAGSR